MSNFTLNQQHVLNGTVRQTVIQNQKLSIPTATGRPMTTKANFGSTGFPSALSLTDTFMNSGLVLSSAVVQENATSALRNLEFMATGKAAGTLTKSTKIVFEEVWRGYVSADTLKALEDLSDAQYKKIFGEPKEDVSNSNSSKSGSTSEQPSSGSDTTTSGAATSPTLGGGAQTIVSPYGQQRTTGVHTGVDIAAVAGTPVIAPVPGNIITAGWSSGGFGNYVIEHINLNGTDYVLIFAHLQSIVVQAGQTVTTGQLLGYSDSTGNSDGDHLHFEMRLGDSEGNPVDAVDPTPYLNSGWVVIGQT